ncbi:MAG: bifunctional demethylmenaquinone methyltransferase/2-methoxy-6-polyprenyl-1,4-benzoquinol methylase UbiE [Opitutales bacterium]|tara:strand:- start:680 stop:1378 length:699 start_codon:yes stop_codon:yes gene_type:complete
MPEATQINTMFGGIAKRYDRANHILSFGMDFAWRRFVTKRVATYHPKRVLDLATGSGDLAFALKKRLGKQVDVKGADFCQPMLEIAEHKQRNKQPDSKVSFSLADCLSLPFDDNSVDVVTIAFGLRNLEDRAQGLAEIRRVLRKEHGALLILEFSQPDRWLRPFYYTYLKYILPSLASMTTRNASAYHYLAGSIEQFPNKGKLCEEILHAGFSSVQAAGLTGSIVAVHEAMV